MVSDMLSLRSYQGIPKMLNRQMDRLELEHGVLVGLEKRMTLQQCFGAFLGRAKNAKFPKAGTLKLGCHWEDLCNIW